jgi:hypothetical protein
MVVSTAEMRRRGERWSNFCAQSGLEDRDAWRCISRGFLDGEEANCPTHLWDGVSPADVEARETERRARLVDRQVERLGPMLVIGMGGLCRQAVLSRLENMVEEGMLEPEAAADIAERLAAAVEAG